MADSKNEELALVIRRGVQLENLIVILKYKDPHSDVSNVGLLRQFYCKVNYYHNDLHRKAEPYRGQYCKC